MKLRLLRFALLLLGIVVAGQGFGQDVRRAQPAGRGNAYPGAGVPATPAGPSALERSGMSAVPVDVNRRLAVGDIISVQIQEDRELAVAKRVSATGELDMSPFGRIRVSGKSTAQVESELKALLEKDYYYTATVVVSLDVVNPIAVLSKITISGEVRAPGPIEVAAGEKLTLSEAILRAGNFTPWAQKDKVKLFRGGRETLHDVRTILKEGRVQDDPVLEDGDRINVAKNWFNFKGD
ncbi:MAG: polysaccharide biosynthesis/export family protein [Chthoniobacteraceae bacterium]